MPKIVACFFRHSYIGVLMSERLNCRLGSAEFFNNWNTLRFEHSLTYIINIKCNLYLQIPFLANSIPCKLHSLQIPFPSEFHSLQCPFLADSSLSFLGFSIPCKFRTLPKTTTLFPFAFPCKFISLQSGATPPCRYM